MTYTIEQRAGFPTLIGPDTTRQATNVEVELIAERDALRAEVADLKARLLEAERGNEELVRLRAESREHAAEIERVAGQRNSLQAALLKAVEVVARHDPQGARKWLAAQGSLL